MRKNGFTLIEIIIAIFVGSVIMIAVYGMMEMAQKNSTSLDRKVITQQDTRTVLDLMASEIRMASYNPTKSVNVWSTMPICMGGLGGITQSFQGIQIAKANKILIAMDLDKSGSIGNVTNEYIMYSYDSNANKISRNVSCGGDVVLLGPDAAAVPPIVTTTNVLNQLAGVSLFQYFDKSNNNITATVDNNSSTVNGIPAIRRILITIVADTAAKDLMTGQIRQIVYSTSVIVRNHAPSP